MAKNKPGAELQKSLLLLLQDRFSQNPSRHKGISWNEVEAKLKGSPQQLRTLSKMERTGGEPDVIGYDKKTGTFLFCDCSAESPAGRRSLCYDQAALDSRKENKPGGAALEMAKAMGAELLTADQYRALQQLGKFDQKTSSWIQTPVAIRKLGGALFCDRRYDTVFVYHNGAESYYAARGFRTLLSV
ncbi:MAG: DUF4256 domain-containing protein [Sphingobacteriales bacterium]|nr:DUF4256 domain-containing protein [Sphingobacteriales bacterium]